MRAFCGFVLLNLDILKAEKVQKKSNLKTKARCHEVAVLMSQ